MTDSPHLSDDLTALIKQAETQTVKNVERVQKSQRRKSSLKLKPVIVLMMAGLIAYSGYSIWTNFAPPSEEHVVRDLESVVDAARAAIEEAKAEAGQLPEALPNAALASVVQYEHGEKEYKLSATIMGIRITLEPDGKTTREYGVE
jgi:hypothetical protein